MDFKEKFKRIKTKKRIKKSKKEIISGILLMLFFVILWMAVTMLAVVLNNQTKEPTEELEPESSYTEELETESLYGEREVVEFPFEKLENLPNEPDWKSENVFNELLEIQDLQYGIQQWFENIYLTNTGVVNKSKDPIPLKSCRLSSMYGLIFFKNNGNLVVVYHAIGGSALMRLEVFPESIVLEDGRRYCCTVEEIIDHAYYIDYENNNTLYYYVEDGTPQILKVDEGVEEISGFYLYNYFTNFPILQKGQEIYTYEIEEVKDYNAGSFAYEAEELKLEKVILSDMEGVYEKSVSGLMQVSLDIENGHICINLEQDKIQASEGQSVLISELIEKGAISKLSHEKYHDYIYLDKSKGYDNDWLY